ncbi:MAG: CoA transferase [Vulcanimicrobiaceae bacterium]
MNVGALSGLRVLELGSTVAAPAAGRMLADLGATVYKVEPPEGDQLRTWGPQAPDGSSWWFKSHNRNKSLLSFDLREPRDAAVVRRIALSCDVVLENFRPGYLARIGLDAATLRAEKPDLVYASISGYGQDGPYADRPGYGNIAEAMGGFRYITGEPDGAPMRMGISIGDEIAGLHAVIGILAALRGRDRDGAGETIDVALVESTFSLLEGALPEFAHTGEVTRRNGNRYLRAAPSSVYPTRDGEWLAIGGNGQTIFKRLADLIGAPELSDDPRFATNQARVANAIDLDERISAWTRARDLVDANDALSRAGVPAGPVLSVAQIARDPHMIARGAVASVPDDDGTQIATYTPVPRLTDRPSRLERAAGAIGRDQHRALHELGIATTSSSKETAPL